MIEKYGWSCESLDVAEKSGGGTLCTKFWRAECLKQNRCIQTALLKPDLARCRRVKLTIQVEEAPGP